MISVLKIQKFELDFEDCRNITYEDIAKNQLNKGKLKIDQDNIFEDCRNIPYEDTAKNQLNKGKLKIDQDNIPVKALTM